MRGAQIEIKIINKFLVICKTTDNPIHLKVIDES